MDVPSGAPTSRSEDTVPPLTRISVPVALPRARVRSVKCETEAMLGSASPRNPSVRIAARSSAPAILLVAWRSIASRASSGSIPSPSSSTRNDFLPPSSIGDRDPPGARIERVLDQLFHDRRRTLDDFAGGDLIGEVQGGEFDGHETESCQSTVGNRESSVAVVSHSRQFESVVAVDSPSRQSKSSNLLSTGSESDSDCRLGLPTQTVDCD